MPTLDAYVEDTSEATTILGDYGIPSGWSDAG